MTASLRAPNACSIVRKPEDHRHGDRRSHAPPWSEKIVVNDQIVGTLICQPPGHPTDRHYHLVDEWWFIVEGAIDWEIETMPRRFTRAPGTSSSRRPCTITTSVRPATGRRSAWPSKPWRASTTCANNRYPMRAIGLPATFEAWQAAARALLREGVPPGEVEWREAAGAPASEAPPAGGARVPRQFLDVARQAAGASDPGRWAVLYAVLWRLVHESRELLASTRDPDVRRLNGLAAQGRREAPQTEMQEVLALEQQGGGAAPFVPTRAGLDELRAAAARCEGCDLFRHATQTVFGRGPSDTRVVLVGEQPGDQEDLKGAPFVGPAGEVLDRALGEA